MGSGPTNSPETEVKFPAPLRVLIVDDDHDLADSLATLISSVGHRTTVVYDGLQALKACEETAPHVALVDLGLPHLNGLDVADAIRHSARANEIVLISISGWENDVVPTRAAAAGFNHHLTKPVGAETILGLLRTVQAALQKVS